MTVKQAVHVEMVAKAEGGPGWRAGCDACAVAIVSAKANHVTAKADAVDCLDRACPHGRRHRNREVPRRLTLVGYFAGSPVELERVGGVIYGPSAAVPKSLAVHVVHDGTAVGESDAADFCDVLRHAGYVPLTAAPRVRRPPVVAPRYKILKPPPPAADQGAADLFAGHVPPADHGTSAHTFRHDRK